MRVDVQNLVLRYGKVPAINDMSFTLESGKIYGLLGRNGSGKTTLLSMLAAFRKQSEGTVLIDGQPVFENSRLTPEISLIRDAGETVNLGTGEDAVYFAEWLRPRWDSGYAKSLMDLFKINPKQKVSEMSKGQRSAMGVVIGLASRAPLTMFDESYLGMDAPSRQAFYDAVLADYLAHPRTIILSTHLIQEVSPLFEEVLIIDKGQLLVHEECETLLSRGTAVTGPATEVDAFTAGLQVLGERSLGPTKSAMVYGDLEEPHRRKAVAAGLDLGPIDMQDLFIHLTGDAR